MAVSQPCIFHRSTMVNRMFRHKLIRLFIDEKIWGHMTYLSLNLFSNTTTMAYYPPIGNNYQLNGMGWWRRALAAWEVGGAGGKSGRSCSSDCAILASYPLATAVKLFHSESRE